MCDDFDIAPKANYVLHLVSSYQLTNGADDVEYDSKVVNGHGKAT